MQEMFGHANISITLDTYSHVIEGMDVGLGDAMEDAPGLAPLRSPSRNVSSCGLQYGCSKSLRAPPLVAPLTHRNLPAKQIFYATRPAGFEPATGGLEVRCSVP